MASLRGILAGTLASLGIGCGPAIDTPEDTAGSGSEAGSDPSDPSATVGTVGTVGTASTDTGNPTTTSATITTGDVTSEGVTTIGVTTDAPPPPPQCVTLATWNPNDAASNIVLSEGNLQATVLADSVNDTVRATAGVTSGRWYWEIQDLVSGLGGFNGICVGDGAFPLEVTPCSSEPGAVYSRDGNICTGFGEFSSGLAFGPGSIVGVALDANNGAVWFHVDGVWQLGDGPSVSAGTLIGIPPGTPMFPCLNLSEDDTFIANFGQREFVYGPPPGFFPGICE